VNKRRDATKMRARDRSWSIARLDCGRRAAVDQPDIHQLENGAKGDL